MRYFILVLFTTFSLLACETPSEKEVAALNDDLAKYESDYKKKCQDRTAAAVSRLKTQLAAAKGDDAIAIKSIIDSIAGAAEPAAAEQALAPAAKPKLAITDKELILLEKDKKLNIDATVKAITDRLGNRLSAKTTTIAELKQIIETVRYIKEEGYYHWYRLPVWGSTTSEASLRSRALGTWCAVDPVNRWKAVSSDDITSGIQADEFLRVCFYKYRDDSVKYQRLVQQFARATNSELFAEFKE